VFTRLKTNVVTNAILKFLGQVPTAVKDHINVQEAVRIAVAAALAGGGIGGVAIALVTQLPTIVTPGDLTLATALVTVFVETVRRFRQGVSLPANWPPPNDTQSFHRMGFH